MAVTDGGGGESGWCFDFFTWSLRPGCGAWLHE